MIFVCFSAIALKWLIVGMYARVSSQIALLHKRSSTNFTFERLLASMSAKMFCQMIRTRTRFIARSTHVWSDEHVSSRVSCQSAFLIKSFITHSAFERLLASMRAKMSRQIPSTRTRPVARSTHVWSDEHVSSRVNSQIAFITKRFITLSAFERLLARMYTLVSFQMLSSRTRFIARSTHEWCDERVSSRVNSQIALSIERFITHSAFERLLASMRAKMKCQSAFITKRFIALSAFERLLASMYAKMSRQSTSSRKIFIAHFTDMSSSSSSSSFFINSVVVVSIWNF